MNFLLLAYKNVDDKTPDSFQANEKDLNDKLINLFQSYEIVTIQKEKIFTIYCYNTKIVDDNTVATAQFSYKESEIKMQLIDLLNVYPSLLIVG